MTELTTEQVEYVQRKWDEFCDVAGIPRSKAVHVLTSELIHALVESKEAWEEYLEMLSNKAKGVKR